MNDLTAEEIASIMEARRRKSEDIVDRAALEAILARAKSVQEAHQLAKMIERRGGPPPARCRCGGEIVKGYGECQSCIEIAYGK